MATADQRYEPPTGNTLGCGNSPGLPIGQNEKAAAQVNGQQITCVEI